MGALRLYWPTLPLLFCFRVRFAKHRAAERHIYIQTLQCVVIRYGYFNRIFIHTVKTIYVMKKSNYLL